MQTLHLVALLGNMTSQNFPRKKGKNSAIYPLKTGLTLKSEFYVQNRSSRPKIDPPPSGQFQQFPSRGKLCDFVNFWDVSIRKEQQQPP